MASNNDSFNVRCSEEIPNDKKNPPEGDELVRLKNKKENGSRRLEVKEISRPVRPDLLPKYFV